MKNTLDMHTHSVFSNHAISTITENIEQAHSMSLLFLGLSDHAADHLGAGARLDNFGCLRIVPRDFKGMKIFRAVEINAGEHFRDNFEFYRDNLDYGIASLHGYIQGYGTHSIEENTAFLMEAIDEPFIKILGHIDDGSQKSDLKKVVAYAKKKHVLVEINEGSLGDASYRQDGLKNVIELAAVCKELECPIILNSDAHIRYQIGVVDRGYKVCQDLDYPEDLILNFNIPLFKEYFDIK